MESVVIGEVDGSGLEIEIDPRSRINNIRNGTTSSPTRQQ